MEKEEIKKILIDSVNSFDNIDKYEMIGIFGAITKEGEKFADLDLISFSDNKVHNKFRDHLVDKFEEVGIKIRLFETVTKKPEVGNNVLLVHDLHYSNINDFLKKEWKIIINAIIEDTDLIYGNNIIGNLPKQKISKKDLCSPFIKWTKKINTEREFKLFKEHILKHLSNDFYEYGFRKEGDHFESILNSDENWKVRLDKVREVLKVINFK